MRSAFIILITVLLIYSCSKKEEIYQWRGENRSGIFNETGLLDSWPENGPNLIWFTEEIGNGYGSPTITDENIYIQGEINDTGYLFVFDLDGKLLWKKPYGPEWVKSYRGSRSCPTIVDNLVYVCSGFGKLTCFDINGRKKLWSVDLKDDFNGKYTMFGHSESPLVFGDKVFLVPGGTEHNVVALNRFNGKLIWSCKGLGERPGYNSPKLIELENRNILVTFSAYALMGIDIKDGTLLWTHAQDNIPIKKRDLGMGDTHSNTVLFDNGNIYYVAGDGNCAVKLELSEDGTKIKEIWRNKKVDDYMGGIVKLGNYIYTGTIAKKSLVSVEISNGEVKDSLQLGRGNTISDNKNLYYYTYAGKVNLVKQDKGNLDLISTLSIKKGSKEHFSQPVIKDGVLYVRHGNALIAYDIQQSI